MTDDSRQTSFDRQLDAALAVRQPATERREKDHPDDLALAAFLEGHLAGEARDRLEAHLASCDACRELVTVSFDAASDPAFDTTFSTAPRVEPATAAQGAAPGLSFGAWLAGLLRLDPPRSLAAVAALLVLAVAAAVLVPRPSDEPGEVDFGNFVGGDVDTLRGTEDGAPELVEPSFSVVASTRPELRFAFDGEPTVGRILVVDEHEDAIGLAEVALVRRGGDFVAGYPESFPDLRPGGLYAWKVDVRRDGSWVASAFAPFRVDATAVP